MQDLNYKIDMIGDYRWEFITPDNFAKENLLYMQEVGCFSCGKKYFTRQEGLDSYLMKLTLNGSGILEYCGETYKTGPGEFFLIDCSEPQKYYTDPEKGHWNMIWVHFYGATARAYYDAFLNANNGRADGVDKGGACEGVLTKLLELGTNYHAETSGDIKASMYLTELLASAVVSANTTHDLRIPDFVSNAVEYIHEHFDEPVSLDSLSRVTNVSKFHLQRQFSRCMGTSPGDYLRRLRLNKAKEFLRETDMSVGDVASAVGMDYAYFVQIFRKSEGTTPGEYRKKWVSIQK